MRLYGRSIADLAVGVTRTAAGSLWGHGTTRIALPVVLLGMNLLNEGEAPHDSARVIV